MENLLNVKRQISVVDIACIMFILGTKTLFLDRNECSLFGVNLLYISNLINNKKKKFHFLGVVVMHPCYTKLIKLQTYQLSICHRGPLNFLYTIPLKTTSLIIVKQNGVFIILICLGL